MCFLLRQYCRNYLRYFWRSLLHCIYFRLFSWCVQKIAYIYVTKQDMDPYSKSLAPQSGALWISAYRDFLPIPSNPHIAFEHLSLSMVIWNSPSRPRQINALLVKLVNGVWKVLKVDKSRHSFSFNKTHKIRNFTLFEIVMTQILHQKIFTTFFWKQVLPKLRTMFKKSWRGAQLRLIFCMVKT